MASSTQNIIEYLNAHDIKWFPIDINAKKEPVSMQCYGGFPKTTDINKLSDIEIQARHKFLDWFDYIAIDTNTVNRVDVDTREDSKEYYQYEVEYLKEICPYFESVKKKLPYSPTEGNPHIFCKF